MLSVLFYIVFALYTLIYFLVFSVVFIVTVPFDRNRVVLHHMSRLWTKGYFAIVPSWKLETGGMENIGDGPYVVIVNHRSMVDIILMYVLPFNFKWVSKKEVYKWPFFGWVLWMHGDIAIERGTASGVKKMIKEGRIWLSRGVSVVIFPEGSRGKTDGVGKFKEGAFLMAKEAGAAILPCVAVGSGTATNGWKINFRNRYKLKVLPPVSAEEVRSASTKEMAARMRELISTEYDNMK